MRALLFPFFISSLLLPACEQKAAPVSKPPIPKALQAEGDRSGFLSSSSYSVRGYSDLVDKLYAELAAQDATLKKLETQLQALQEAQFDSTKAFEAYSANNEGYYESAGRNALELKDSLLRKQMEALIAGSRGKYKNRISRHRQLLAQIEKQKVAIADLHEALKISFTLPIIEKYQRENLPPAIPLERLLQMQQTAIKNAEALLKK